MFHESSQNASVAHLIILTCKAGAFFYQCITTQELESLIIRAQFIETNMVFPSHLVFFWWCFLIHPNEYIYGDQIRMGEGDSRRQRSFGCCSLLLYTYIWYLSQPKVIVRFRRAISCSRFRKRTQSALSTNVHYAVSPEKVRQIVSG